jgi:hypothetical protein
MKKGMGAASRRRATIAVATAGCAIAGAMAVVHAACVPADTRPPPGVLTVTVSPSTAIGPGVTTADGWHVTFTRVFVAMGNEGFSDQCTVYGEADYDRVVNVGAGPGQKLGILHGIGRCDLRFRLGPPSTDAVLGANVTDEDKTAMETPIPDAYTDSGGGNAGGSGAGIDIAGVATRNGTSKTFHLIYRRRVRYQRCTAATPPADASASDLNQTIAFDDAGASVDLSEGQDVAFDLRIEPEAVLRDDVNPSAASLRFDPFAAADVDGDGVISLDELRGVPIASIRDAGPFEAGTYDVDDAGLLRRGRPIVIESLGDFVYELLFPTLPRFRDVGWCVSSGNRPRGPD